LQIRRNLVQQAARKSVAENLKRSLRKTTIFSRMEEAAEARNPKKVKDVDFPGPERGLAGSF
jgi:hypothetical protein